jgi:acyl-CoA reductase-like NAD-dependent aldehyde dehydrogenase
VQDRPACRVLRYAAAAAAEERQAARPAGRRHNAFYLYLDSLRRNEERLGLEALQAGGGRRAGCASLEGLVGSGSCFRCSFCGWLCW